MYQPAFKNPRYREADLRISRSIPLPPPVGGLNLRDAFADMPVADAVQMMNVFPGASNVMVRGGHTSHATGLGNKVESLLVWRGVAGVDKIFGAAGTSIFDVTAAAPVGTAALTGLTNARWQWTNLSNAGGHFMVACNGADSVRAFDGTTWTTPVITGVASNTLVNVFQFKQRLYFAQNNSLDLWYLPSLAIAGAASVFPLGAVFRFGGYITALGSFSNDAGEGPDDYFAIVTSNGEVAVYQGTDPDQATTIALVGLFTLGKPLGRRCLSRLNGDLTIVTVDGAVSMQAMLQFDRASDQKAQITGKIQPLYGSLESLYGANFGWQSIIHAPTSYYIVNVPTLADNTQAIQLVMNTFTGAWAAFDSWNAICWGVANDNLYFGAADGTVWQAAVGFSDNGNPINFELGTAWQNHARGGNTLYTAVRPNMLTGSGVSYAIGVDVDFKRTIPLGTVSSPPVGGSMRWPFTWSFTWGGLNALDSRWRTAGSIGVFASIHLKGRVLGAGCAINSFDLVAQRGGVY